MLLRKIIFNTTGRDQFIDFLKAYAILCVLFAHTFPYLREVGYGLWAGMQVPVFLLIQVFHAFKSNRQSSFKKILNRIFIPFLVVQVFILILIKM